MKKQYIFLSMMFFGVIGMSVYGSEEKSEHGLAKRTARRSTLNDLRKAIDPVRNETAENALLGLDPESTTNNVSRVNELYERAMAYKAQQTLPWYRKLWENASFSSLMGLSSYAVFSRHERYAHPSQRQGFFAPADWMMIGLGASSLVSWFWAVCSNGIKKAEWRKEQESARELQQKLEEKMLKSALTNRESQQEESGSVVSEEGGQEESDTEQHVEAVNGNTALQNIALFGISRAFSQVKIAKINGINTKGWIHIPTESVE